MKLPEHGGNLEWAEQTFGHTEKEWLDLSTGISPWSWPVPHLPSEVWRNLPPTSCRLAETASGHFDCDSNMVSPVPGSQYALSEIPAMVTPGNVYVPSIGYKEHEKAWRKHGHTIFTYDSLTDLTVSCVNEVPDSVILINPNNPSGILESVSDMEDSINKIRAINNDVLIVIDEAFIDLYPECSLVKMVNSENCVVLRSFGKFFGLAGARLGFVISKSDHHLKNHLQNLWYLNHPGQYIGENALKDLSWIQNQRIRIKNQANEMAGLLSVRYDNVKSAGLFLSVYGPYDELEQDFELFAKKGKILLRLVNIGDENGILRFGLPGGKFEYFKQFINGLEQFDA